MIEGDTFEFEMDGLKHKAQIEHVNKFTKEEKKLEIKIIKSWSED